MSEYYVWNIKQLIFLSFTNLPFIKSMNTANINTTSPVKRYISEMQELWGLKNLSAKQIKTENNTKNQFEYCP